jgi:superfamily I DNA/RNA helicase
MLTGVHETLRSSGLELRIDPREEPQLGERLEELREYARAAGDERAIRYLETSHLPEELLDLSDLASPELDEPRRAVEAAALEALAARDREQLQELLLAYDAAYREAKDRESALDFEDLQLLARDLLQQHPEIRERESWRFRSIMVDEFQDTNWSTYSPARSCSSSATSSSRSTASATPTSRSSVSGARPSRECWR